MMNSVKDVNLLYREENSALPPSSTEASDAQLYLLDVADGKAEVFVLNAGSLVFFYSCLNGQKQDMVLNSSLLAQLAAKKKYDRFNDTKIGTYFTPKLWDNLDGSCRTSSSVTNTSHVRRTSRSPK